MIVEKGQYGQWCISCIINGVRLHRQYYNYTKHEAIMLFQDYVKEKTQ